MTISIVFALSSLSMGARGRERKGGSAQKWLSMCVTGVTPIAPQTHLGDDLVRVSGVENVSPGCGGSGGGSGSCDERKRGRRVARHCVVVGRSRGSSSDASQEPNIVWKLKFPNDRAEIARGSRRAAHTQPSRALATPARPTTHHAAHPDRHERAAQAAVLGDGNAASTCFDGVGEARDDAD